ncbi:sodium/potassium-transporting ATPase subunit beta-2-like [Sitodiplosis mosellana]|uniref:sodium/potassium-transporting ATPase subunit beta-2-like n=1 Tax=Sitodiplosis mosellana TaxID=263140 RepID=UPI0024443F72|nr:sodium/potassium-transporting ATPase subunit beta-2-like [Sitodiplosis mosellana]
MPYSTLRYNFWKFIIFALILFIGAQTAQASGLEYCPMPPEAHLGSTLIWYRSNRPDNMVYWHDTINKFLDEYTEPKFKENIDSECNFGHSAAAGKYCPFRVESLDNCSPGKTDRKYGFPEQKPCIFLRLNNIYDWTPRVFNETDENQISDEFERSQYQKMPDFVRDTIGYIGNPVERNIIWVSCEGKDPVDVENLGPVRYTPRRGFPAYYFPFTNVKGYQAPVVAVQFERPKTNIIINIVCKAWAKNILNDPTEQGSVQFQLLLD